MLGDRVGCYCPRFITCASRVMWIILVGSLNMGKRAVVWDTDGRLVRGSGGYGDS